jgi:diadenosine tetraphosphatase ApaH/serine/threonine PP2A family protein phosphatase
MRVAVLSDVHANLAALESTLVDVDTEAVDEIWCLGDLTGYGARPTECVDLMRERAAICLCGNHDLVVRGDLGVDAFTSDAAAAAAYAREVLPEAELEWLRTLAPLGQREGVELYHGSIRDPVWEYVLNVEIALACLSRQRSELALVGHSHVALAVHLERGELKGGLAAPDSEYDLADRRCLLNPGSVGQPRDRDPRAAWLLLDLETRRARFRRSAYDIERTQREIREAGLPERLASRLSTGI